MVHSKRSRWPSATCTGILHILMPKKGSCAYDRNLARSRCRSQRHNQLGCLSGKISKELIFLDHGGDSESPISVHDQVFKNPVQCTQRNISEGKCWQISLCNQGRGIYATFSPLISPDLAEGRVSIFVLWQKRAVINSSLRALPGFFQVTVCLLVHL